MSRDDNLLSAEVSALNYISGFCNEKLHNLYSSPYRPIIRVIKTRMMSWTGNSACMGQAEMQHFGGQARSEETTIKT
jgi:hypothetical protein